MSAKKCICRYINVNNEKAQVLRHERKAYRNWERKAAKHMDISEKEGWEAYGDQ